jgi:hypothetical protein
VDKDKTNSGFSLIGKSGMLLFRTYNFRVNADMGYKVVFNDDKDQGIFVNLGLLWHQQPSLRSGNQSRSAPPSLMFLGLAGLGGLAVLLGAISLFSSMMP